MTSTPGDLDTWGDYGRACQIDGYAGALDAGDDQARVLADEPASTTYLPDQRLFVRWIYADSEADVIRLIPKAVETADWEDVGTWTTSGPAELFDSTLAGDEMEDEHRVAVDVAPGTYLLRTAHVEPEEGTALVLVQLVAQTLAA
ncbi:Imm21 family immunity protein [Micromonospora chersina]|uniref:Imm21 family immunity protein n=1 Tax=Micromonospora chersina TaxID=47854 RepID=UPI003711EC27